MKKIGFVLFTVLLTCFFNSCSLFNSPVKNYLKEYTENAAVEDYELDGEYPKDNNGNTCISSDSIKTITFTMRNPQEYVLNIGHVFDDTISQVIKNSTLNPVTINQKSDDTSIFYASFSQDLLVKLDCGGDFSSTFTLTEPKSMREFDPYKISLKVNSVPQAVRNLTMLQDSSTGKYVLAFNMPDLTGIHRDIVSIKINDDTFTVAPTGNAEDGGITGDLFSTKFENSYLPAMANGAEFSGKDSARSIYYKTAVAMQTEEYPFTVTLTDAAGLSVAAKVSSNSEKLENITFNPDSPELLDQDSNGYGHVTITAPASNSDSTVYYNVYYQNGKTYKQGGKKGSVELLLGVGKWKIEAWAHKEGYMDSNTSTINPGVKGFVYVNPSYTGDIKDGGKNTPYLSIADAVNNAGSSGDELQIELLDNCTVDKTITLNCSTLIQGGKTISGADVIFDVANDKKLTLNNTNITKGLKLGNKTTLTVNGSITIGGDITIGDKASIVTSEATTISGNISLGEETTLILKGASTVKDVTMSKGSLIKYDNLSGSSSFGKITHKEPANNLSIIESANSTLLTKEQIDRFILNNPGYFLDIEDGKGLIKMNGVILVNNEKSKVILTFDGLTESPVAGIYTISTGETVTVTFKNESGIAIMPEPVNITIKDIYLEGSVLASSETNSLVIPNSLGAGTYNLTVQFEYKGKTYRSTIIISVS